MCASEICIVINHETNEAAIDDGHKNFGRIIIKWKKEKEKNTMKDHKRLQNANIPAPVTHTRNEKYLIIFLNNFFFFFIDGFSWREYYFVDHFSLL